jgi:hypothetical protein
MARWHVLLARRFSVLSHQRYANSSTLMIDLSRVLRIPNLEEKFNEFGFTYPKSNLPPGRSKQPQARKAGRLYPFHRDADARPRESHADHRVPLA